jgi:WD40 repeat protein
MISQGSEKCHSLFYLLTPHDCTYRDLSAIENGLPEDDSYLLMDPNGPIGKPIWSPTEPVILSYN